MGEGQVSCAAWLETRGLSLLQVQELEVRLGGEKRGEKRGPEALFPADLKLSCFPPAMSSMTPVPRAAHPVLPCKVCFSI